MDSFIFTLNTVMPVFLMILIGKILRKTNIIDDNFISKSSDLVFTLALPALIFQEVSAVKIESIAFVGEISFTLIFLTAAFIVFLVIGMIFIKDRRKVGVFTVGIFRGNYGIVGLALLNNMYGEPGLAKGAIILSIATICYNVYSTIAFIIPHHKMTFANIRMLIYKIFTNPIIIGALLAFVVLFIKIFYPLFEMPLPVKITIRNFASLSLPVALIGIGGAISFTHLKENKVMIILITGLRTIIIPLLFTPVVIYLGFNKEGLAGLFMLLAVPTATAIFVVARSMDGDAELAANVVAATTLVSVVTIAIGIFIMRSFNLI